MSIAHITFITCSGVIATTSLAANTMCVAFFAYRACYKFFTSSVSACAVGAASFFACAVSAWLAMQGASSAIGAGFVIFTSSFCTAVTMGVTFVAVVTCFIVLTAAYDTTVTWVADITLITIGTFYSCATGSIAAPTFTALFTFLAIRTFDSIAAT